MAPEIPHHELLLAHSDWVRALALRIVRDEQLAEDVVQETWLAALAAGRRHDLPGWLFGVARNLARRAARSRERRRDRELHVQPASEPALPETVLQREQVRRRLVEAVLALEEPYRSTLLLRYYEDLAPAAIARKQGVPAATVRTRLKRGVEQLRDKLAVHSRTERDGNWLAGLALLTGDGTVGAGGPTVPPATPWPEIGVATMSVKTGVWLAAGGVLLLSLWFAFDGDVHRSPVPEIAARAPSSALDSDAEQPVPDPRSPVSADPAAKETPATAEPGAVWRLAIDRESGRLSGHVLDLDSQEPLEGVRLEATAFQGPVPRGFALAEDRALAEARAVSDARGGFAFPELPAGPYRLRWSDRAGRTGEAQLVVPAGEEHVRLSLGGRGESDAPREIVVRVVDAAGAIAAGARATLLVPAANGEAAERAQETDEHGLARFAGTEVRQGIVLAAAEGEVARRDLFGPDALRRAQLTVAGPDGEPLEVIALQLGPPCRLEGRVAGDGSGAIVHAWARPFPGCRYASTPLERRAAVADGAFAFDGLPAGCYAITVTHAPGFRLAVPRGADGGAPFTAGEAGALEVVLRPGETKSIDLQLVPGPLLEGVVVRAADGSPVENALVRAVVPHGMRSDPARVLRRGVHLWRLDGDQDLDDVPPSFSQRAHTGADGRYRFDGLPADVALRIEVSAPGLAFDRREDVRLAAEGKLTLEHALEAAGGVQGVTRSASCLGLRPEGATEFTCVFLTPDAPIAPFTILGLAAGKWEACAVHSTESVPPVPLATFEIRAGELAWLDLRDAAPYVARGRVLLRGAPLAGAILDFFSGQLVTDAQGRFGIAHAYRHEGEGSFLVHAPIAAAVPVRFEIAGLVSAARSWSGDVELPEGRLEVVLADGSGARASQVTLAPLDAAGLSAPGSARGDAVQGTNVKLHWRPITRAAGVDGSVRFDLLPAGRYRVSGVLGASTVVAPVEIDLAAGESRVLELAPGTGGALDVLCVRDDGAPVAGVELSVWREGATRTEELARCCTDLRGRARLEHLPAGRVRISPLLADRAAHPPGGSAEIRAGETVELVLTWGR